MPTKPILIVEDDPDIRANLRFVLEDEGFIIFESSNGQEALNLLRSKDTQLPGLVFLDLQMPVLDGRGFLQSIENDSLLANLPIIVITAGADRFQAKIKGFMKKPLDIEEVVAAAKKYATCSDEII